MSNQASGPPPAAKPPAGTTAVPVHGAVIARLEQLTGTPMQIRARIMVGAATFFDGFDVISIAAVLPLLIRQWSLTPWQIGFLLSAGAGGQLIGALLFPLLAERWGRIRAITLSSGLTGLLSIGCALTDHYGLFMLLRFLQGIGLGGELPVAASYINEIIRAEGRGRFVLMYETIFPLGLLSSMALSTWLVPTYGWHSMYWVGGLPLLIAVSLPWLVPESPRWLAGRGRLAEAGQALTRLERAVAEAEPVALDPARVASFQHLLDTQVSRRARDLFRPDYLRRTLVVATIWITCGVLQYGLSSWLPTIYREVYHAPLRLALNLAVAGSVSSLLGSLASALLVDAVGRKPVIVHSFLGCTLSLVLAGLFRHESVYLVAGLCALALGLMSCGFLTAYVYTPEQYPTSIRAIGAGLGGAWLKIASLGAPLVISGAMQHGHLGPAFYGLALVPLVAAVAVWGYGIETRGQVLEQLEIRR